MSVNMEYGRGTFHAVSDYEVRIRRLAMITRLTDTAISVPGTDVKLGLDAIVGAVPVIGDMAMLALSVVMINDAHKLGVPSQSLLRMTRNSVLDATIGSVPFVGDLFDLVFRANERNLRIIEEHLGRIDAPVIDVASDRTQAR
jgi:Domain of unknown function (DUF4112)